MREFNLFTGGLLPASSPKEIKKQMVILRNFKPKGRRQTNVKRR